MTLSQSAVSDLLDAFRSGDGVNLIRDAVQLVLQEMIETEAIEHIGAGRYERSDDRVTERNGQRPRLLATQAGDVELRIPKPGLPWHRRWFPQAPYAVPIYAAKAAASRAAMRATNEVFALAGTRSVARSVGWDRLWRDVRTMSLHDPVDWKHAEIGHHLLRGWDPPPGIYQ